MIVTMTSRPRRLARDKGYNMATKSTNKTRARATLAQHAARHATARKAARKRNAARGVRLHNDNAGSRLMDAALALADTRPVMPRALALADSTTLARNYGARRAWCVANDAAIVNYREVCEVRGEGDRPANAIRALLTTLPDKAARTRYGYVAAGGDLVFIYRKR
jgi:hypothetical protein